MSDPLDDLEKPSAARMYDYLLGGYHNIAADRELADQLTRFHPNAVEAARANRSFLRRAVEYMLEQGIDQFLDLGSGIPTKGNVHEIVARYNPDAHVVYVDMDPVAVVMSERILGDNPNVGVIQADARDTRLIMRDPVAQRLLDFSRPIGVLMVALLHFIPSDSVASAMISRFADAIASGSYIALTHGVTDNVSDDMLQQGTQIYAQSANPVTGRTRAQIAGLLSGFTLVEPGLVDAPLWRPESEYDYGIKNAKDLYILAAVGRKD